MILFIDEFDRRLAAIPSAPTAAPTASTLILLLLLLLLLLFVEDIFTLLFVKTEAKKAKSK